MGGIRRSRWRAFLVATLLLAVAGCEVGNVRNSWSHIPQSIAGEELVYHELHGAAAHDWALEVLATTNQPAATLRSATGFTFPDDNEYQSHVIQILGVDGRTLITPLIQAVTGAAPLDQREETIAGKAVLRYNFFHELDAELDHYAYAFDNVAIVIFARRAQEAEEALRAMP